LLDNYDLACEKFEKAIALEPENIDWRNYIGGLYLEK
jgi:hypothetical protein